MTNPYLERMVIRANHDAWVTNAQRQQAIAYRVKFIAAAALMFASLGYLVAVCV